MKDTQASAECFVALELSRTKWLLGPLLPNTLKVMTILESPLGDP